MGPFLVAIVAILAWAFVQVVRSGTAAAGTPKAELEPALRELQRRLDEAESERVRLRQRVENLEAIVTSEPLALGGEASRAGVAAETPALPMAHPPLAGALDDLGDEPMGDEAEVARRATRLRG